MANIIVSIDKNTKSNSDVYNYDYTYSDINMKAKQRGNNGYAIQKSYDINAIKNSIHNIFTWIKGERILDPDFGTSLRFYLYEGITDYNTEKILSEIRSAVSRYEPRVSIEKIVNMTSENDIDDNTIHLEVIYSIPSLSNNKLYNESIIVDNSISL